MMGADSGDKPPRARRLSAIDQDWGGGDSARVNGAQAAAALNAALGIDPPATPNTEPADDNDRTMLSSDLPTTPSNEPLAAAPDNDTTLEAPAADNDRTAHGGPPAAINASSVDRAPANHARKPLSVDDALVALNNDRTIAGIGVTPVRASPLVVMHPPAGGRSAPAEPSQPVLQQPEQSPLSFVLRASEPTVAPAVDNHDMSMFVAGLVADTSPVVETSTTGPAMEPLMRRSRKRRQWIIAGAISLAAAGSAAGVYFATGSSARSSASEAPVVASAVEAPGAKEVAPPPAPPPVEAPPSEAAAPSEGAVPSEGAPAEPNEAAEPSADPAPPMAIATVEPTAKPATTVAKKTVTAKPKVVATKSTTAKPKTTATKSTTAKPKTTATKSTAKKAPAKKTATKKTAAKPKTATTTKKKTATKPGAAKKRTSSKASTKKPTKRPGS